MQFFVPGNFCAELALAACLHIPLFGDFMIPVVNEVLVPAGGFLFASGGFVKPRGVTGEIGGHIRLLIRGIRDIGCVGLPDSL